MIASPRPASVLLLALVGLAGTACATNPPPADSNAAAAAVEATDATNPAHARLAQALRDGAAAQARGHDGADALLAAANRLLALGASPVDGGVDLARQWRDDALAAGAQPRQPPMRGRALGAAYARGSLAAGGRNATRQVFLAGKAASVTVVPLSEQAIDVAIGPENKPAACARRASKPQASCRWIPGFTERYVIELANHGPNPADYFIIVD
ncbi:hypothetical protein MASR1M8_10210 [Thermomonas brevis]